MIRLSPLYASNIRQDSGDRGDITKIKIIENIEEIEAYHEGQSKVTSDQEIINTLRQANKDPNYFDPTDEVTNNFIDPTDEVTKDLKYFDPTDALKPSMGKVFHLEMSTTPWLDQLNEMPTPMDDVDAFLASLSDDELSGRDLPFDLPGYIANARAHAI